MSNERFSPLPIEDAQLAQPLKKKNKAGMAMSALAIAPLLLLGSNVDKAANICSKKNRILVPGYTNIFVSGTPPKDGVFKRTTYFGCDPELGYKDDKDNCKAAHQKQIPVCNEPGEKPLRGRKCQAKLIYFSANATQYLDNDELGTKDRFRGPFNIRNNKNKLHTKLKVTNIKNGKSVIVMPIDWGPGCQVQKRGESKFDLSYRAYHYIKSPGWKEFSVKVEKIPQHLEKSTPLGPVKNKDKKK